MTSNRLLITAMVIENRPVREVAATYGVSASIWGYLAEAGEKLFAGMRESMCRVGVPRPHSTSLCNMPASATTAASGEPR